MPAPHLLAPGDLLDKRGELCESGYAFSQVKRYDRSAIKGNKLRIKEWDYYSFCDNECAVALTVADNSYMSLASVSVMDFTHLKFTTKSKLGFMPRGKTGLPSDCSSGNVEYDKRGVKMSFAIDGNGARTLTCEYKGFAGKRDLKCEIVLEPAAGDNITVAIPFGKKHKFYYNTKVNCLKGSGRLTVGDETHEFKSGYGGLDWGRGVWPYRNTWYWSSLSCDIDGKPFGLNLGYGFGRPVETENVIFYDGKAHKLGKVKFDIPYTQGKPDYLKPWRVADDDERLNLMFYPMIDRKDKMNALILASDQHQVFGKFYGRAALNDGTILTVTDKIGFAEQVVNKW